MGILAMWALQAAGARVAVCQTSAARRRAAADLGADGVLDPQGDLEAILGGAPTAAIVTAPGGRALGWALERMEPGGRVHVFAGSVGGAEIDANVIHYNHLALVGSTGSALHDYRQAYGHVTAGSVPLDRLPRVLVSLEEAADSLRHREPALAGKTVIDMRRAPAR
jgi:threonine dehydrogenase-like Zn-dependent dehydrogenase